ncbi:MAG: class I SAM-dependent methyltransferase [Chloroflexi bacterium]|nr:MAG: class I SAM-dependent methyltransferase [Chloroflexota bacterium]
MKRPSWYPDELAHAGPEHLDDAYVATYDRKAGFDPTDELGRLRALGLNDAATLVDLGAGTGALALAAAPFCRRVVAVDVSSAMLAALRQKATQRKLRNVESVRSGFLTYEHTGDPADFVFSRHALHQLPDLWKAIALQRVAGFLRLGGVLGWTRAELETHLREEHSTFTWLFEPMLVQAGFEVRNATYSDPRIFAEYTCVRVR